MKSRRRSRKELFERLTESHRRQSDNLWHYWQEDYKRQRDHNDEVTSLKHQLGEANFYLDDYEKRNEFLRNALTDADSLNDAQEAEIKRLKEHVKLIDNFPTTFPQQFVQSRPMPLTANHDDNGEGH